MPTPYDALMNEASENPTALAFWRDRPLAPETDFMARRIAEELARQREPTEDDLAVWLSIPVREMYRADSQPDGDGVREHLRRLTSVYLSGGHGEARVESGAAVRVASRRGPGRRPPPDSSDCRKGAVQARKSGGTRYR